jgi:anti-sigma-K factor RskA
MSKRLEDFIKNNNEEFDDLEPGNDLWSKIEAKLPLTEEATTPKREAKTFTLGFVMRVAALIIVVMAVGFAFYIKNEKHNTPRISITEIARAISPEYAKQQAQYASLVETKRVELKALAKSDPQLYQEFSAEIAKMDSTYKKLNRDLATSPDQESVLRAMIRNLQIQTDVLNQQLQVIEQFNNSKKEQHHAIKNI